LNFLRAADWPIRGLGWFVVFSSEKINKATRKKERMVRDTGIEPVTPTMSMSVSGISLSSY